MIMNILNKFDNVEIKNDTRISEEDLKFCEKQQSLYFKILDNYKSIYNDLKIVQEKEKTLFKAIEKENVYSMNDDVYKKYDYYFVTTNKEEFTKIIIDVHRTFITTIFDYFAKKYNVSLDKKSVEDITQIQEPDKIDDWYYRFRNCTPEEIEKFKERNKEYEKELNKYRDKIIAAKIDFNIIVDNIFVQLEGYSFVDKAKKEIVDNCKLACFNKYRKYNYAGLKKDKIVFEIGFNSHFDSIWKEYEATTNNYEFKSIIKALTFFDSEENNYSIYDGWRCSFVYFSKREKDGIYGIKAAYGNKVESFKFYKNGKWEVKFNTQEDAEKFFNEYCKC